MNPAPRLAEFQSQFGDYLRRQEHSQADESLVPERVGRLYQELIFNSVATFPKQCFPICQALLPEQFDSLCQKFFADYRMHSPYFTDINRDFVDFIQDCCDKGDLPSVFADLSHYEWVELMVDILPDDPIKPLFGLEKRQLALNPTIQNLHYGYPVHQITSQSTEEVEPEDTFLVMYRGLDDKIHTTQVNALTHLLLNFMLEADQSYRSIKALLKAFLPSVGAQADDTMVGFALELIEDLLVQGILIEIN